jgi:hypothetical protein
MGLLSRRKATPIRPKVPREVKDSEDDEATPEAEPSATDIKAKRRVIAIEGKNKLVYDGSKIEVIPTDSEMNLDVEIEFKHLIPKEHTEYLDKLVAEAEKAQEEAPETDEERNFAKEYFEKKLCSKAMKSGKFSKHRIVVRIEVIDENTGTKIGKHCTKTQHVRYCDRLGISDFSKLEPGAGQYQDNHPPVAQAQSAAIKSDTPKTTGHVDLTDAKLFSARAKLIQETGKVVIASEVEESVSYYLVQYADEVRILEKTKDTESYTRCIAAGGEGEDEFAPLSHIGKLETYAEKGLDSFKKIVKGARLAKNVHPTSTHPLLGFDIWLFRIDESLPELRCYSYEVKEKLLSKLGVLNLDTLMITLNPTPTSQATIPNTPSPSPQRPERERKGRTRSPEVMESIEESTASFYKPGDGSGKYRHIATNVGGFNGSLQENTQCIVQNADDGMFRLCTWAQVIKLDAEDDAMTYMFYEEYQKTRRGPDRDFHSPDSEGMEELIKEGTLLPTEYSIDTILTWRVEDLTKEDGYRYSNSVILNITNEKKKKIVMDSRKKRDCKYEGPSRCSITTFRNLVGGEIEGNEQAMDKLQQDTEAGKGYYRYLQKRVEGRAGSRDGSRARSRDYTPSTAGRITELQGKLAKASEENKKLLGALNKQLSLRAT